MEFKLSVTKGQLFLEREAKILSTPMAVHQVDTKGYNFIWKNIGAS